MNRLLSKIGKGSESSAGKTRQVEQAKHGLGSWKTKATGAVAFILCAQCSHACQLLISADSGATVITAIRVLVEHGVKEENILLLNVFATPNGEYKRRTSVLQNDNKYPFILVSICPL